jgi:hypothetical protein
VAVDKDAESVEDVLETEVERVVGVEGRLVLSGLGRRREPP